MSVASDLFDRQLRDLRISVTDRCNFRCTYCMPKEVFGPGYRFLPRDELLTFSEIETLVRHFVGRGVRKVRITGGEPLPLELAHFVRVARGAAPERTDAADGVRVVRVLEAASRSLASGGIPMTVENAG